MEFPASGIQSESPYVVSYNREGLDQLPVPASTARSILKDEPPAARAR